MRKRRSFGFPTTADELAALEKAKKILLNIPAPPPKPDPFEEAWKKYQNTDFSDMETPEFHFHKGWDAAIKWKEGQK